MKIVRNIILTILLTTLFVSIESIRVEAATAVLAISPTSISVGLGQSFNLEVTITDVFDLYGYQFKVFYNTTMLTVTDMRPHDGTTDESGFFHVPYQIWGYAIEDDPWGNATGYVSISVTPPPGTKMGKTGSGTLADITFSATAEGRANIRIVDDMLTWPTATLIPHTVVNGVVTVVTRARGGLVLATGGLGDKSFNDVTWAGVKRAEKELGIDFDYVQPVAIAEYEGYQRAFAATGDYDIIICVGFDQADALTKVAAEYPLRKFAIVDGVVDKPNVASLLFKANAGSFLVGVIAGMKTHSGKVGFVGGMDIPLVRDYFMGYEAGVKWANSTVQVVAPVFVGSWADPTKGKELAMGLIDLGVDIIYSAAGKSGYGVLQAVHERGILGLGVDACQCFLYPEVIASMTKRVDVAAFDMINATIHETFQGGIHNGGLKEGWVGCCRLPEEESFWEEMFGFTHAVLDTSVIDKIDQARDKIVAGEITVPPLRTWIVDNDGPADFAKIQDAVNAANIGDIIIVMDGTYTENINVSKRLAIKSDNGADATIVQAANPDDHVFEVTTNYVSISGFTVKGATARWDVAGIYLEDAAYCNVYNNTASSNSCGIYLRGSSHNSLTQNNVNSNSYVGIYLRAGQRMYSSNNKIEKNRASNNGYGIELSYSGTNNVLTDNTMLNNVWNFGVSGSDVSDFIQDINTSNHVNGKPIRYLINQRDLVIDSNWDIGYLGIVNSTNITVKDLTLGSNIIGVQFAHVENSRLENVTLLSNNCGIYLSGSSSNNILSHNSAINNYDGIWLDWNSCSNKLENNNVTSNRRLGIGISRQSSNNELYLNNFMNNTDNVYSDSQSTNIWSSTSKTTYTFNGNTYINYLGNYWDDYAGSDTNNNGIGDTPYSIDSDKDNYPLMKPFENYEIGPDFSITASPSSLTIQRGSSGSSAITVESMHGFDRLVFLQVSGATAGVTISLSHNFVAPGPGGSETSTLTVTVDSIATLGSYTLTVTGVSDTLTHEAHISLQVELTREEKIRQSVAEETIQELSVTLSEQYYSILTLKSYINPTTLDVTPNTETKIYSGVTSRYPLSEPDTARKIGLIDYARSIAEKKEEILQTKEILVKLRDAFNVLKLEDLATSAAEFGISGMRLIRDMKSLADILKNIETLEKLGKAGLPRSVSGFAFTILEWALRGLILDPFQEVRNDLTSEFSQAIDSWNSVLTLLDGGEITGFSAARNLVSLQLNAKTHEDNVYYLLERLLSNYCSAVDKIAGPILNFVTLDLFRFVELFWEAADVLDWTIELTSRDIISLHENDAFLQFKLVESAEYTLKLAGASQESISAYKIGYANLVAEGYAEAAKAIAEILTINLPIIGKISIESPGELRAYDAQGRVTGIVDGQEKNEIPYCWYFEGTIIFADQISHFEVLGMQEGAYGLKLERTMSDKNETVTFAASAIPTKLGAVHEYLVDWAILSQGAQGVSIRVDTNGDGTFEKAFTTGSELTRDEFTLQVRPVEGSPIWIVGAAVGTIAIVAAAIAVFWRKRKQPSIKG